jgi:tRNA(adenine34) deaminase
MKGKTSKKGLTESSDAIQTAKPDVEQSTTDALEISEMKEADTADTADVQLIGGMSLVPGFESGIDLISDGYYMGEALRQARRAWKADEVPVGAVIVLNGEIIARAFNQVELLKDATAHAEMLALTQAQEVVGDWRLTGCTLYVTKEPCPMCAGALVHTRCTRVVYGVGDPKAGAAGGAINLLQFPGFNHRCQVTGQVEEGRCREILREFFAQQRLKTGVDKRNGPTNGPGRSSME